ncbi:MAG: GNAT family N-acetyltransferase [Chloroflexi bacterium]|nr:GNAT family N-acetyltransferase [Chloroflexota bacterium]OJV97525.1 MAG: hypothetical protein BGO39_07075 [Chloroflexi bacterium 54-19]
MKARLVIEENASPEDVKAVSEGLGEYNRAIVGPENYAPLRIFLRDEQNRIVGGILGVFFWGWLAIEYLWVSEALRGQGYGTLLLETAETEARKRGVKNINLDTMSFQAPDFYLKMGYRIFGQLDGIPEGQGHIRYFLTKKL